MNRPVAHCAHQKLFCLIRAEVSSEQGQELALVYLERTKLKMDKEH